MPVQRVSTAGRFILDIDGQNVGFLKKFSGLDTEADIITDKSGPNTIPKKHVSNIKWTPARASIGINMGKVLSTIIEQAFSAQQKPFDCRLDKIDSKNKVQSSQNALGCFMTGVTIPKLDGASKDAAYFDLEWEAETVRWMKGTGANSTEKVGPKQKAWISSNFRFEMGNLPCNRVKSIDSFTWQTALAPEQVGASRVPSKQPTTMTVPDINLTISMADFDAWQQAAEKWFIDGHNAESDEMTGAIHFLDTDMKTSLGVIELLNCGFKMFSMNDLEANSEKVAHFTVVFYVEQLRFKVN